MILMLGFGNRYQVIVISRNKDKKSWNRLKVPFKLAAETTKR
jgi:hypothetical protein